MRAWILLLDGEPREEKKCVKEGVISDPDEEDDAEPKQMFIVCFPIGGGKYGGVKGTCADISATAIFAKSFQGCVEPCASE